MTLEEIERQYCTPNPMENRHGDCCPMSIAQKLMDVAKSAKDLTNIWEKFNEHKIKDLRGFYELMQKYCDEYGALQIRLRELEK